MSEPVRWGVLGAAKIALTKVIPGMQGTASCDVVAIASRDADRASAAAERAGVERSYGTYEALLADPDIEAVYIPLPNHLHAEWTIKAAQAGKHVLCEKPLALTAAEAQTMVDACRDADVLLMEAFMYRLHPSWLQVRELVDSGRIGELRAIQGVFSYTNRDPADIRNVPEYGGGALMDIGCYPINVARMLFGSEPTGVQSAIHRDPEFGIDDLTSAVLDFAGRQATFTCSTQLEPDQWIVLMGTTGRILVEIPFNIPPDRSTRLVITESGRRHDPAHEVIEVAAADQYGRQGEAFSAAVRGAAPLPTTPEDAVANMSVIERIFAAGD
jgi:predicted dehydrogenase